MFMDGIPDNFGAPVPLGIHVTLVTDLAPGELNVDGGP
jgi:hypothetical protein